MVPGSLGALALWPANSLFVEGYLTTRGDSATETYRMIEEAGFRVEGNPSWRRDAPVEPGDPHYRIPGDAGELLKPEIARSTRT